MWTRNCVVGALDAFWPSQLARSMFYCAASTFATQLYCSAIQTRPLLCILSQRSEAGRLLG
jgi:hypothetical protein